MNEKVEEVNALLAAGEPANISIDTHSGYVGYKPQAIIDAMNEVFQIGGWGFEEVSNELALTDKTKGLAIAQVRVWLQGIDFKPTGWGQARITQGDLGDARKGAVTDGIKKALSYFSIGNRAYLGYLADDQAPVTAEQIETIRDLCNQLHKRIARPLNSGAANDIIAQLREEVKATEASQLNIAQ